MVSAVQSSPSARGDALYDVVVLGLDRSIPEVAEGLQRVFGLDAAAAHSVISALPATVCHRVNEIRAQYFIRALRGIGARVELRAEHELPAPEPQEQVRPTPANDVTPSPPTAAVNTPSTRAATLLMGSDPLAATLEAFPAPQLPAAEPPAFLNPAAARTRLESVPASPGPRAARPVAEPALPHEPTLPHAPLIGSAARAQAGGQGWGELVREPAKPRPASEPLAPQRTAAEGQPQSAREQPRADAPSYGDLALPARAPAANPASRQSAGGLPIAAHTDPESYGYLSLSPAHGALQLARPSAAHAEPAGYNDLSLPPAADLPLMSLSPLTAAAQPRDRAAAVAAPRAGAAPVARAAGVRDPQKPAKPGAPRGPAAAAPSQPRAPLAAAAPSQPRAPLAAAPLQPRAALAASAPTPPRGPLAAAAPAQPYAAASPLQPHDSFAQHDASFWPELPGLLTFPFRQGGLRWLISIGVWALCASLLSALGKSVPFIGTWFMFMLNSSVLALSADYHRRCMWAVANAEGPLAEGPDFDPVRILHTYMRSGLHLLLFMAVSQLPLTCWLVNSVLEGGAESGMELVLSRRFWLLACLPALYWPMAVATASLYNRFQGVWYVPVGVRALVRAPLEYAGITVIGCATFLVPWLLCSVIGRAAGLPDAFFVALAGLPLAASHAVMGTLTGQLMRARPQLFEAAAE